MARTEIEQQTGSGNAPSEKGAAGIIVTLSKGVLTVKHEDSPKTILLQRPLSLGGWNRLWQALESV